MEIENGEDLEKLEELASLQNQVEEVRLQDQSCKQNFHENLKNLHEALICTLKATSEKLTKTVTETYFNNKNAIEKLNGKVLELMNKEGMIAPYLASSSVNLLKPENKSQFRLIKDINLTKMSDFLINTSVPVTLDSNILNFRDSNDSFKIDGDLLKTMTNYEINVDHSSPQDHKTIYEFGKEKKFDIKQKG